MEAAKVTIHVRSYLSIYRVLWDSTYITYFPSKNSSLVYKSKPPPSTFPTPLKPIPPSHYSTMPMQSHILAPPFYSSSEIIPFNPVSNSSILRGILESSFLTMMLKYHHIHPISEIHNFHSLDFDLTNGIWHILKDLSRSIHEATDPTLNPFEALPSQLNPTCLGEIEMLSHVCCRLRTSLRICYFALRPVKKFTNSWLWCRLLGWKPWNGLWKLRGDVE